MTIQEKFGIAVRNRRKALGISQEQLAFDSNLHRTYMGSVERGERNISLQNIISICRALKVVPSELLKDLDDLI